MTTCTRCYERAAVNGTGLCRACAAALERIDRRARPDYYHALSLAKRIDIHDVRKAGEVWAAWPGWQKYPASENHVQVGARCVATLDGVRYLAGVIVGAIDSAAWVWLLDPPRDWELHVPIVRAAIEGVEIVERRNHAQSSVARH